MQELPKPPGYNAPPVETPEKASGELNNPSGKLNEDEFFFICKATLLEKHRTDPYVMKFISAYMRCRNVGQASREAGLEYHAGYNLRKRPDIHGCIEALTSKSLMKFGFDASEIVERVKEISEFDPVVLENEDGSFKKSMREIPPEARRVIKKLKVKNVYEKDPEDPNGVGRFKCAEIIEYDFYDKLTAHTLLGREKEVFKEKKVVEHDVTQNMAQVLLDSSRRGEERKNNIIDVTPAVVPQIGEVKSE